MKNKQAQLKRLTALSVLFPALPAAGFIHGMEAGEPVGEERATRSRGGREVMIRCNAVNIKVRHSEFFRTFAS